MGQASFDRVWMSMLKLFISAMAERPNLAEACSQPIALSVWRFLSLLDLPPLWTGKLDSMTGTLRTGPISFSLFALSTSRARCSRTVRAPQEWGKGIFPWCPVTRSRAWWSPWAKA